MTKDSKYVKINSINPLYLILIKVNGHFEETNGLITSYELEQNRNLKI